MKQLKDLVSVLKPEQSSVQIQNTSWKEKTNLVNYPLTARKLNKLFHLKLDFFKSPGHIPEAKEDVQSASESEMGGCTDGVKLQTRLNAGKRIT